MLLLGSQASQQMKLLEVHYENIMILDYPVMTNDSQVKSNVRVNDQAVSDQTTNVRADYVNTADPQMKSGAYQGLTKESILRDRGSTFVHVWIGSDNDRKFAFLKSKIHNNLFIMYLIG